MVSILFPENKAEGAIRIVKEWKWSKITQNQTALKIDPNSARCMFGIPIQKQAFMRVWVSANKNVLQPSVRYSCGTLIKNGPHVRFDFFFSFIGPSTKRYISFWIFIFLIGYRRSQCAYSMERVPLVNVREVPSSNAFMKLYRNIPILKGTHLVRGERWKEVFVDTIRSPLLVRAQLFENETRCHRHCYMLVNVTTIFHLL